MDCPKCGKKGFEGDECPSCGVIVSKYLTAEERRRKNKELARQWINEGGKKRVDELSGIKPPFMGFSLFGILDINFEKFYTKWCIKSLYVLLMVCLVAAVIGFLVYEGNRNKHLEGIFVVVLGVPLLWIIIRLKLESLILYYRIEEHLHSMAYADDDRGERVE